MKILSLFDGMSCGMIAMKQAGVQIDRYVAYEIDKYAVQSAIHNFPEIEEQGDVFSADFTQYKGFDWIIAGFPCTTFSIAQKKNREISPYSGPGWDLFSKTWEAIQIVKPKFFLLENNESMAKQIQNEISEIIGFDPVHINSALLSAQNRKRIYWVGKRNRNGSYSKVNVRQPEDLGIMLKDVLDRFGAKDLTPGEMEYMLRETRGGRNHFDYGYIQDGTRDKGACLTANVSKGVPYNVALDPLPYLSPIQVGGIPRPNGEISTSAGMRLYSVDGKGRYLCANGGGQGAKTGLYAVPIGEQQLMCVANHESMNFPEATKLGYTTIHQGNCLDVSQPHSKTRRGRNMEVKCNCLTDHPDYCQYVGVMQYAAPCEWDETGTPTKAISTSDGQIYTVYPVFDNKITFKDRQYPIKLIDGYYIIRKLTVGECKRLQTVPAWYEFPVSNTQALKQLGNGWTCSVITHLIESALNNI